MSKHLPDISKSEIDGMRAFHARRDAARRAQREASRQERLEQAKSSIREIAPKHPAVSAVYLFGSLVKPGHFSRNSDVDMAVVCEGLENESSFWSEIDQALEGGVDLRPLEGAVARAVNDHGELVYEREISDTRS